MSKIAFQADRQPESSVLTTDNKPQIRRQQAHPRKQRRLKQRSSFSTSAASDTSDAITDDGEECASFLLILKYRISPNLKEDIEKMKHYRVPWLSDHDDNLEKASVIKRDECFVMVKNEDGVESYSSKIDTNRYKYETMGELLGDSDLFAPEDFVLVPDYIFYAMSQMKMCHVEEVDRVGCYKTRPLGFAGMCCKHCGGRPGSGKYFPATIRGLAQTTTTHTIIKHVESKCRRCPANVRQRLLDMQTNSTGGNYGRSDKVSADYTSTSFKQDLSDSTGPNKPKYGSRKVFFERLWGRLHNEKIPEISKEAFPGQEADNEDEKDKPEETDICSLEDDKSTTSLHYSVSRTNIPKANNNEKVSPSLSQDEGVKLLNQQVILSKKKQIIKKSKPIITVNAIFVHKQQQQQQKEELDEIESVPQTSSPSERRGKRKRKAPKFFS